MNIFDDLTKKSNRTETWAKYIALGIAAFAFAPFAVATIKGLLGLIIFGAAAATTVYVILPWFSRALANWHLKLLKAEAAAHPIETLENRYNAIRESLLSQRDNIKARIAVAMEIHDQIVEYEKRFHKPSPRTAQYNQLNALIEIGKKRYENAKIKLEEFEQVINEKRADWKIVLSMKKEADLAMVGQEFTSKLMADTALSTIQDGVNMAFAELDAAVMDENIDKVLNGVDVPVVAQASAQVADNQPAQLASPSDLDFDAEPVGARRQKIATH